MLNNEFPPLGGGTATVNFELLREFSRDGELEIDLITGAQERREDVEEQFSERIRIIRLATGVKNVHHATGIELLRYAARAFPRARREHRLRSYDVCLAFCTVPAGAVAYALYQYSGLPFVVRVSGPDIPNFERRYRYLYPILTPLLRVIWRSARAVVVKCAHEARLVGAAEPKARLVSIANAVDSHAFAVSDRAPIRPPLRLLTVGRLIVHKRHDVTIRAMASLLRAGFEVVLTLVGEGDDESRLRNVANELGVGSQVSFVGYVPRASVIDYYRNSDLFVLASENEGMSVAVLEAMASGLPVIAAAGRGAEELVEEGVTGSYFVLNDSESLANQIRAYAQDPQRIESVGRAGRDRAQSMSWKAVAMRVKSILSQAASQLAHRSDHSRTTGDDEKY